jgi:hypothetical protein
MAWLRAHALSLAVLAPLLVLTGWLVETGASRFPAFADDEGTYVAEAWSLMAHGQLSHYTYWYDHPPLGWIQLGLMTVVFGGLMKAASAVAVARKLMLLPALTTAALLYLLGRRASLRRPFAALAVALLVCSPLGLVSLREVYLDTLALPWLIGAFVLAATPARRLWAFAGAGVCFAIAVLTKETMLLFGPGLVLAVAQNVDRRTRAFCVTAFFAGLVLVGAGYPLYAALKGELAPGPHHVSLYQAAVWQLFTRQPTGSVLASNSPAHGLLASWLSTDPWLLLAGLGAVIPSLAIRRLRAPAVGLLVAVVVAAHGGYLPEPFVIGLLPFCALLAAGVLDQLLPRELAGGRRGALRAGAVVLALALFAAFGVPRWVRSDRYAMRADPTGVQLQAERWIEAHVPRRDRVMVDDTLYVDLVHAGFKPRYGVVWFSKLGSGGNRDPAISRALPDGWREFSYVVDSATMRNALGQSPGAYPEVTDAVLHSRPVVRFGSGKNAITIRQITRPHLPRVRR